MTAPEWSSAEDERGVAAMIFAVFLVVLVGVMAFVVDLGYAYYSKQRLQDALDLAAIAAARELNGETGYTDKALTAARDVLAYNYPEAGEALTVGLGCVHPGQARQVNLCIGGYEARNDQGGLRPRGDRFAPEGAAQNAARLFAMAESPSFFARVFNIDVLNVGAVSTAVKAGSPRAQLTIRSTLASLDNGVLNQLFGLLGGKVNLSLVGWDGLAGVNLNLLDYLDTLIVRNGVSLNLNAGDYDQVLDTQLSVSELLDAAVDVLGPTSTAGIALELVRTGVAATAGPVLIRLGDLIGVQSGSSASALDVDLGVLDVLEGTLLAANKNNALAGELVLTPDGIGDLLSSLGVGSPSPGLGQALNDYVPHTNIFGGTATVRIKFAVIEAPRISAIGNPEDAKNAADQRQGPGAIYVRTAQLRLYISIDLPIMHSLTGLLNAIGNLLSPLAPVVNSVLGLNVVATVGALLSIVGGLLEGVVCLLACDITKSETRDVLDIKILDRGADEGAGLDLVIDVGGGEAYVTDYTCDPVSGDSHLSTEVNTSVAKVNVGNLVNPDSVFSSSSFPQMDPAALLDFGTVRTTVTQRKVCGLLLLKLTCSITTTTTTEPRQAFTGGGIGLKMDAPLLGDSFTSLDAGNFDDNYNCSYAYSDPPPVGDAPAYCSYATDNVIDSLRDTLASTDIQALHPSGSGNVLSNLLFSEAGALTAATSITETILRPIVGILSNLLDPLLNVLLDFLGLKLNQVDVGANLSCSAGSRLVN